MSFIKKYNTFVESSKDGYSIYDWFEDLKLHQWNKIKISESELQKWTDHFIGYGWYSKISEKIDDMNRSLSKPDYDEIWDRFYDLWDSISEDMIKTVSPCYIYGGYERYYENSNGKYNGTIFPTKVGDKKTLTMHIIKEILYPTLYIGYPSVPLRRSKDEIYVTDPKWQCQNFDINNYSIRSGQDIKNGEVGRRGITHIYDDDINKRKIYSPKNVLEMYKPAIYIGFEPKNIGSGSKFSLRKIEGIIDDVMDVVLPQLDYEDIIWDYSRGSRLFKEDDFSEYRLKIILK